MIRRLALALCLGLWLPTAASAQDAVRAAEARYLAVTPLPIDARRDAAAWRDWRAEAAVEDRAGMDADRIAELDAAVARDRALADHVVTFESLVRTCPPLGVHDCRVEAAGVLNTPGDEETGAAPATLYWQQARGYSDFGGAEAAVLIYLAGADGRLRPAAWVQTAIVHEPPVLIEGQGDLYVAVPGYHDGTGHMNADVLFRWTPGAGRPFTQIDVESWKDGLAEVLPPGLEVWKGVAWRWRYLMAETSLWQQNDANCCPTGGEAWMDFRIEGDALVLDNLYADPDLEAFLMTTPPDAVAWMGRWTGCAHWAGEEPNDAARRAEIEAAVVELRCEALESDWIALKARYAGDPVLLARIARFGSPDPTSVAVSPRS